MITIHYPVQTISASFKLSPPFYFSLQDLTVNSQLEALLDANLIEHIALCLSIGYRKFGTTENEIDTIINILIENISDPDLAAEIIRDKIINFDPYQYYLNNNRPVNSIKYFKSYIKPGVFLDVGGGTGSVANELFKNMSLGINQAIITDNRMASHCYSGLEYRINNPEKPYKIPVKSNYVNTLLLHYVLHHTDERIMNNFLEEIMRVLVPGGVAIIFEDAFSIDASPSCPDNPEIIESFSQLTFEQKMKFIKFMDWFSNRVAAGIKEMPYPNNHKTLEEWLIKLREAAFKIDSTNQKYIGFLNERSHHAPLSIIIIEKPMSQPLQKINTNRTADKSF